MRSGPYTGQSAFVSVGSDKPTIHRVTINLRKPTDRQTKKVTNPGMDLTTRSIQIPSNDQTCSDLPMAYACIAENPDINNGIANGCRRTSTKVCATKIKEDTYA